MHKMHDMQDSNDLDISRVNAHNIKINK